MSKERDVFIQKKIAGMTLMEKIGQLLTFTRRGTLLTPSGIEQITRLHCGGLCLEPYAVETCKNLYWGNSQIDKTFKPPEDYFKIANNYFDGKTFGISITPEEYTKDLNRLQKIAMSRPSGIPLHMTIDFEGDFKNDYMSGGIRQFPGPMGMAAIGDEKLTYEIGKTIARMLTAIGVTQMYSPVCDVNTNPRNPEIGVRSFSDDPEVCARHAVALIRGLQDYGIAATAKHFPGRGDSGTDAHDVLEVLNLDKKRMHEVELVPFKAAIDAGVKAIMTGHSVYPAYDDKYPTTLSERILTGLLREELGFEGVIVSDAIGMAAILKQWPLPQACAMAIKAGCDTILLKADDESRSQCFFGIKMAVERGELSEERINQSVARLLKMKYDQGLFETAGENDPEKTREITTAKEVIDFSWDVAKKALIVMRDEQHLLPLDPKQRILVIEQRIPYEFLGKDPYCHTHMFCEAMVNHSQNLILADTAFSAYEDEIKECLELAKQVDLVVMTNYYARIVKSGNNRLLVKKLKEAGHKVIVVTNNPYIEGTTVDADAVVCNFSGTPDSIRVSTYLLYGKVIPCPTTKLPVKPDVVEKTSTKDLKAPKKHPLNLSYC
ncbi:MAG TPA: glycoside hydrolase family 3 protein [Candidatus Marinimicrobia bacterium]|nr:glycoside hydrolase family 3 protein [Candidatus Neomarinimicrobiota bacterium]HRS52130.1 glycoside hydrolase family 3 protein [Candidatus Neomarinimicrobiota bacterium]HRU92493.1 glycoside hydrolase family 3 protein [Candidatus Neomarinimicrobiota bacterium]